MLGVVLIQGRRFSAFRTTKPLSYDLQHLHDLILKRQEKALNKTAYRYPGLDGAQPKVSDLQNLQNFPNNSARPGRHPHELHTPSHGNKYANKVTMRDR